MALYQKIYVTRSTIYMESFILVSQSAQFSHYAALLISSVWNKNNIVYIRMYLCTYVIRATRFTLVLKLVLQSHVRPIYSNPLIQISRAFLLHNNNYNTT